MQLLAISILLAETESLTTTVMFTGENPMRFLFCGDATDRLNEYMKNTSSNYADMHDRYWAGNLADFYELVRNKGEMDLKNQPEWQSSA